MYSHAFSVIGCVLMVSMHGLWNSTTCCINDAASGYTGPRSVDRQFRGALLGKAMLAILKIAFIREQFSQDMRLYPNWPTLRNAQVDACNDKLPFEEIFRNCTVALASCNASSYNDEYCTRGPLVARGMPDLASRVGINGSAVWDSVPVKYRVLGNPCKGICPVLDTCNYAEKMTQAAPGLFDICESYRGSPHGTFCYLKPTPQLVMEQSGTFVLALLSLSLTGFLAIGEIKAGFSGSMYRSVRFPKLVVCSYVALSMLPWCSSLSITFLVMFGDMADVLLPVVLWNFLVADATAKIAVNECSRCNDSWREAARFSGVSTTSCLRKSLALTLLVTLMRLIILIQLIPILISTGSGTPKLCFGLSQIVIGGGIFLSASCLALATTPPTCAIDSSEPTEHNMVHAGAPFMSENG